MDAETLAKQYQRKTDKQHILDAPDTYIGSIEHVDSSLWVFDDEKNKIVYKTIEYVPALYKLFDEGIVNCRDHVIRMIQSADESKKNVTYIETTVGEDGTITFENDGNGIDVEKHPEYDIWIPELIFGHLRTSTNYNKNEEKIVGGKNGFGFKLVLIWSTYGYIETVDHKRGLKYCQQFHDNLNKIDPPKITSAKSAKPYTRVVFKPDYARFGLKDGLTPAIRELLKKRVYDICAVTDNTHKKIKVLYNGVQLPIKNFQQYVDLYIGEKSESKRVHEIANERWEYAVAMSQTNEFQQVSFVNGICTFKGGKHVDYLMGQITRKLVEYIEKKKKMKVNPASIKEQLILFLRCDIVNPAFDSQTKDYMNTPSSKFGSTCTVSDQFIEKLAKMGVMEMACSLTEAKTKLTVAKKTDGSKTRTIRGIDNFIDASESGGMNSKNCILILCEGLSAMSGIVSGLSESDRKSIGIYPLKGKLLNVRGEKTTKIADNKEITDIKKILGLENGRQYKTMEDVHQYLRYGKIMVMTDQDTDGSHIKGLCINLIHSEWSSLTRIPGFISFMNTPILKAKKGGKTLSFYNDGEYNAWKLTENEGKGWTIKYFKGLGTSTSAEFKEYFANKKIVDFEHDETSDDKIDKVFNKKRADDRKQWLENYNKDSFLDTSKCSVTYGDFIDNELIHFSTYDCARSIPNMVDGLKISLRKILYCAFKRKLTSEIRVSQFSAYVSEHSAYHHGEQSLNGAIVNMAQTFVGSNNINLLMPNGQFGTVMHGGEDSASERYIYTQLNTITRAIFPELDDSILKYLDDDGTIVEPEFYVPIIPFALVNGISGIGTGFSCEVLPYNPLDIIAYLKSKLAGGNGISALEKGEFIPYYEGFKGTIKKVCDNKYLVKGCYQKVDEDVILITELPIGTWTMPYIKKFLEVLVDGSVDKNGKKILPSICDFKDNCTEVNVNITVYLLKGELNKLESQIDTNGVNGVEKMFKLATTVSSTNMHMFNRECKLHKYLSVEEIIDEFYVVRMETYTKRKAYLLEDLERLLLKLSNRARYIVETLDGVVDLRKKTNAQVTEMLMGRKFDKIDGEYKYLTGMPMHSVTKENVESILKEKEDCEKELDILRNTTETQLWMKELTDLERKYGEYKAYRESLQIAGTNSSSSANDGKQKMKSGVIRRTKKQ
jgi:DNA topoisomerase-2